MSKTLVIVESPAKAKTIGGYLGPDYDVAASVGHVRDLPASSLGVNVKNKFKPIYITMSGKEAVLRDLKKKAAKASNVLIATDPDREGEAIAWHLCSALKLDPADDIRISFNEITKKSVSEAVKHPRPINMGLVNAQQARRILDRLVGYELSPLLWEKVLKGLSAGRVQSVVTKMIVDREKEIEKFEPEEYWTLQADLHPDQVKTCFRADYFGKINEKGKAKRFVPANKKEVDEILKEIEAGKFEVASIVKGTRKKSPPPPFTTSTMQQFASRYLGFSSGRCMRVAQGLYEGLEVRGQTRSLITYMRTDSTRISPEAMAAVRSLIGSKFGDKFVPEKGRYFRNKKSAQDAHEAIRPTDVTLEPDKIASYLSAEQYKLYKAIWERFTASQCESAVVNTYRVIINAGEQSFKASGESEKFRGYFAVYEKSAAAPPSTTKEKGADYEVSSELPEMEKGQILHCRKLLPQQKFTQPPARYNEASLIKTLEEKGIGRPSTYAPTISTILNRNYAEIDNKQLVPTELGGLVTDMLEQGFSTIVDPSFTAKMEDRLDDIESDKEDWVKVLDEFYAPFHEKVEEASEKIKKVKFEEVETGENCPKCKEGKLIIKSGRYGKFITCNRFPDCDYSSSIEVKADGKCPLCGSGLLEKRTRKRRSAKFYVCDKKGKDPDCEFISWDLPIDKTCPECGAYMVKKTYRGKTYEKCSNKDCPSNKSKSKSKSGKKKSTAADAGNTGTVKSKSRKKKGASAKSRDSGKSSESTKSNGSGKSGASNKSDGSGKSGVSNKSDGSGKSKKAAASE